MIPTLASLRHIADLPHQDLGRVLVVALALRHRDLGVVEDWFLYDAHLLAVQLLDEIILDHAGVDAGLDLKPAVEGLLARDGLHGDHEVEVEPGHVTGHHGQAGGALQVEGVLVEKDPGYLVPVNHQLSDVRVTGECQCE